MTTPRDDDERWLDLVAGRAAGPVDPATRDEAELLRAMAAAAAPPPGAPAEARARAERLVARARAQGLLAPRCAHAGAGLGGRWLRLSAGVAALALVGGVAWRLLLPAPHEPDETPVERADAPLQTLRAADPTAARDRLLQTLREAGADVQPFERLGRPGLDAELPAPLPAPLRTALAAQGLVPHGRGLRVEFIAAHAPAPAPAASAP